MGVVCICTIPSNTVKYVTFQADVCTCKRVRRRKFAYAYFDFHCGVRTIFLRYIFYNKSQKTKIRQMQNARRSFDLCTYYGQNLTGSLNSIFSGVILIGNSSYSTYFSRTLNTLYFEPIDDSLRFTITLVDSIPVLIHSIYHKWDKC